MAARYRVKLLRMCSGERFPLLIDQDGMPLYSPTLYALTQLRGRNLATNTISNALRAIQVLYLFLDVRLIDLSSRLSLGQMLSLGEVEDLARLARLPLHQLDTMSTQLVVTRNLPRKIVSIEQVRARATETNHEEIDPKSVTIRLLYIAGYLDWLVSDWLTKGNLDTSIAASLNTSRSIVLPAIAARMPKSRGKARSPRKGLSRESEAELLRVISPNCPDNPWQSEYVRHRNALIVYWLLRLGVRRGELLGLKVEDVDFQADKVTIHRRADDKSDPRTNQPQTKTLARDLPLGRSLRELTYAYVMNHRQTSKAARKHKFLLCADMTGQPMSLAALNKVFAVLREKCPGLPSSLCPHVLRHTWNDRFSEQMTKMEIPPEQEKKYRSQLMGWSETSESSATYTQRYIEEEAAEVSLKIQERMHGGNDGSE